MTWLPPDNYNQTIIEYYSVILNDSDNHSTKFNVSTTASPSYYLVSTKNFTKVSVTVVDVCGQESEESQTVLNVTSDFYLFPTFSDTEAQQGMQATVAGLTATSVVISTIAVILFLALIMTLYYYTIYQPRRSNNEVELNSFNPTSQNPAEIGT